MGDFHDSGGCFKLGGSHDQGLEWRLCWNHMDCLNHMDSLRD